MLRYAYKKYPTVLIDSNSIKINNKKYLLKDIDKMYLTGKFNIVENRFTYGDGNPRFYKEGMKLYFNDGKELILCDEWYENLYELKIILNNGNLVLDAPVKNNSINLDFRNSQFKNLRGYKLWGEILILGWLIFNVHGNWVFPVIFSLLIAIFFTHHSRLMSFFRLSESELVTGKENLFWYKESVDLNEIYEAVLDYHFTPNHFSSPIKQLRVILNNFEQRTYPTSLLTKKNWEELEKELLDRGIKVRSERNIDYT